MLTHAVRLQVLVCSSSQQLAHALYHGGRLLHRQIQQGASLMATTSQLLLCQSMKASHLRSCAGKTTRLFSANPIFSKKLEHAHNALSATHIQHTACMLLCTFEMSLCHVYLEDIQWSGSCSCFLAYTGWCQRQHGRFFNRGCLWPVFWGLWSAVSTAILHSSIWLWCGQHASI